MWAIIKQQWVLGLGGMQYNVYAFGGHAILSAADTPFRTISTLHTLASSRRSTHVRVCPYVCAVHSRFITKLDVAHQALEYHQPLFAFLPKTS
jgi:hypothetical protein